MGYRPKLGHHRPVRLLGLLRSRCRLPPRRRPSLYTIVYTAKILNVSEKTVRRLIADGWLRVIRTDALLTQDHINLVRMHPASRQGLREPGRNPGRLRCPRLHPACPEAAGQGVGRGLNNTR